MESAKEHKVRRSKLYSNTNDGLSEKEKCFKSYFPSKKKLQAAVDLLYSNEAEATEKYGHISTWDTGSVKDMSNLFKDQDLFDADIGNWDTSSVENMSGMF